VVKGTDSAASALQGAGAPLGLEGCFSAGREIRFRRTRRTEVEAQIELGKLLELARAGGCGLHQAPGSGQDRHSGLSRSYRVPVAAGRTTSAMACTCRASVPQQPPRMEIDGCCVRSRR
jgi:hypothetical protein